ncbi:hypothetical protein SAMN04487866_11744 [Thermoactinomyces sp. DSM 45891]|uniref:hypothetical protein n=1 Tax=Thermoactinomyces sp. DSM 45891 TaxID=1761907 RepID=UPI0009177A32|nr:hypothetical protein [Thermoactinomyces sp. DSM 45891]SFX68224.1 hypothetical protein SAMN04487866_11744 [Thermoactinomyces sp. DSM 45891]
MKLYCLMPEVAGGVGENTIFSSETFPNGQRKVSHLHYAFDGWLGDALLETCPCFIVTTSLASLIESSNLSGYQFKKVEVSMSEFFQEMHPERILPEFVELVPAGKISVTNGLVTDWTGEDFCTDEIANLVVSERALSTLKKHRLNHCDIEQLAWKEK